MCDMVNSNEKMRENNKRRSLHCLDGMLRADAGPLSRGSPQVAESLIGGCQIVSRK
jgi:hypothetical protein